MKTLLFLIPLLCISTALSAQKVESGSFDRLAKSSDNVINVRIDYSDARINNMTFEDFVAIEGSWEAGYNTIMEKFLKEANDKLKDFFLSYSRESGLKLVIKVDKVDKDGETYGKLYLYDENGEVIAIASKINGEGGRWGSQLNLMGDAAANMGSQIGKFLHKTVE